MNPGLMGLLVALSVASWIVWIRELRQEPEHLRVSTFLLRASRFAAYWLALAPLSLLSGVIPWWAELGPGLLIIWCVGAGFHRLELHVTHKQLLDGRRLPPAGRGLVPAGEVLMSLSASN